MSTWFITNILWRIFCPQRNRCMYGANSRSSSKRSRNGTMSASLWGPQAFWSQSLFVAAWSLFVCRGKPFLSDGSGESTRNTVLAARNDRNTKLSQKNLRFKRLLLAIQALRHELQHRHSLTYQPVWFWKFVSTSLRIKISAACSVYDYQIWWCIAVKHVKRN